MKVFQVLLFLCACYSKSFMSVFLTTVVLKILFIRALDNSTLDAGERPSQKETIKLTLKTTE